MENPLTPAGIEQATFGFVAQRLNHCATAYSYSIAVKSSSSFVVVNDRAQTKDIRMTINA